MGSLEKNNIILHRIGGGVVFVLLLFAAAVFCCTPCAAIPVRGEGPGPESGTLITIETLEDLSAATGTAEMESATGTQSVETATAAVAAPDTATATVETAAEELAALEQVAQEQVAEEQPAASDTGDAAGAGETPEAQISSRYEQKKQETEIDPTTPSTPPAQAETEPVKIAPPERAEDSPPEETAAAPESAQPAAPEAESAEEKTAEPEQPEPDAEQQQKETPAEPEKPETAAVAEPPPAAGEAAAPEPEEKPEPPKPAPATEEPAASVAPAQPSAPAGEKPEAAQPSAPPAPAPAPKPDAAPPPKPAPAGEPGKPFVPRGKYTVRSGPITDEKEKDVLAESLKLHDYHPAVREESVADEKTKETRKYYVIEMGRFDDLSMAAQLLLRLREISDEFFIVGGDDGAMVSPESLAKIFPHRMGEGGGDSMALLNDYFKLREEMAVASPKEPGVLLRSTKMRLIESDTPPVFRLTEEDRRLNLRSRLRQIAWEMRADGYDVDLEGEEAGPLVEPEGVFVGMFETEEEALELASELNGSGHGVNVVYKPEADGMYHVYADPRGAGDITIIDPMAIADHAVSDIFNPPPDPAADALLRLMGGGR